MKATEQLKEEHGAIKQMLAILDRVCQKLEAGEKVSPEHLDQIVDFIRVFADKCHHGKEEDLLFPALEEVGIRKQGGPIGVMLTEHTSGRNYVKGMSEAAAKYKAGDLEASSSFVENAGNYIALLNQHIHKEDNGLFPSADQCLSAERQRELFEEFERVEMETIGIGKHEELQKLLHRLEEVYLKD